MALTKVKINLGTEGNLSGSRSIIQSTKTLVSSSAQIASNISGSITSVSSSTATRIAANLASINTLNGSGTAQGVGTSDSPTFNDVTVTGTLTAQEVHTEFESASILFTSGSTKIGNSGDDIHQMTGSVKISGSFRAETSQIQFFDDNTEIGVLENSSENLKIESKVQDKDIIFSGNDGGAGIEAMRIDMSEGGKLGIGITGPGAVLHVDDNSSTAYNGAAEIGETVIFRNKNGSDDSGVNNVVSIGLQVADGATSQGFINYVRTGNNTGEFTFSQRTASSTYAEHMRIDSSGNVGINETDPITKLDLRLDSTSTDLTADYAMFINNQTGANEGEHATIGFGTYNNGGLTNVFGAVAEGTGAQSGFAFLTHNGGSLTEKFRIRNDGEIQYRTTGDDHYSSQVEYVGNDDIKLHFGPNYSFESGFRKVLTLDNQKVGIGTDSPSHLFEVFQDASSYPVLIKQNQGDGLCLDIFASASDQASNDAIIRARTNHATLLQLMNDGRMLLQVSHFICAGAIIPGSTGETDNQKIFDSSSGSGSNTLFIGNAQIQVSSDKRLKINIRDTEMNPIETLNRLRVVDFDWDDPKDTSWNNKMARVKNGGQWSGILAQEAVEVVPHIINAPRIEETLELDHESENTWQVEYEHLVPTLVKAIQELSQKNEALEKRIEELEK